MRETPARLFMVGLAYVRVCDMIQASIMNESDKKEILQAIAMLGEHNAATVKEVRSGFEKLDKRLLGIEEELSALSKTVDTLIEGDVLGSRHITLTRKEYDAFVAQVNLPNRFAH